ncbi:MAG: TrkA family potassium uptake protein [Clostridia bacterium]|nr:TrkA family potassium uptake protein [Clostridia bacterium]
MMKRLNILVLGLKTFGRSIVKQLYEYNCEVLAIDKDMDRVEEVAEYATEAVQVDIRDTQELKKLSLNNFDVAVVTVDDLGISIMATMIFEEAGISKIIVKSTSDIHKKILEKMGVKFIVSPDKEMGIKLAKGIMDINIIDSINASEDYDIVEINVKSKWIGKTLEKLNFRNKYGMNVIGVKKLGAKMEISPEKEYEIEEGDRLIAIENKNVNGKV